MISIDVQIPKSLGKLSQKTAQGIKQGIFDASLAIKENIARNAPVDSGVLRRSIQVEYPASLKSFVGLSLSKVPYARIQEFGGTIKPKHGKYLVFKKGGKMIFAKQVHIKPKKYIEKSFNQSIEQVKKIISFRISQSLK